MGDAPDPTPARFIKNQALRVQSLAASRSPGEDTVVAVVGHEDRVVVADFYNNRVQKFAPDGTFLTAFGEPGDGAGQFDHPIAVAVGDDDTVFVADYGNNRILAWRPPGG